MALTGLNRSPYRRLNRITCLDSNPRRARLQWAGRFRALLVALLCVVFLLYLSGGWLEIPDCLPIIGNLDEVAVTVVLMRCLGRLGFSVMPR